MALGIPEGLCPFVWECMTDRQKTDRELRERKRQTDMQTANVA